MKVKRRMAPGNAVTRTLLMDVVETLMREQGYAAVSARAVAALAGLKYPTVFYYFETMDDLLLTTYRRRVQSVLERTEAALSSEHPLHALWAAASDPLDSVLTLEYIAMSNHNDLIRAETTAFGEQLRRIVAERLAGLLRGIRKDAAVFTPLGLSLSLSSLGAMLGFEAALGISGGHKDITRIVDWVLRRLEPKGRAPSSKTPRRATRRRASSRGRANRSDRQA